MPRKGRGYGDRLNKIAYFSGAKQSSKGTKPKRGSLVPGDVRKRAVKSKTKGTSSRSKQGKRGGSGRQMY